LESLAYSIYRRPLALFFFPEPPPEEALSDAFRTLPSFELDSLAADTRFALRQARAMQHALRELTNGTSPIPRKIFRDITLDVVADPKHSSVNVRSYLGVSIEEQFGFTNTRVAMQRWRHAIEDSGIFVFKRPMKEAGVSGFCLLDDELPVIYVNNSVPESRQIFTLVHELTHILLGTNGITLADDAYIATLDDDERRIEILCNRMAAEILVPSQHFESFITDDMSWPESRIEHVADLFSVSREVILRRLVERGIVTNAAYSQWVARWAESGSHERESSGGNYYANQATYLSRALLRLAFGSLYRGNRSVEQLGEYFSMRPAVVTKFETYLLDHGGLG
jgi:Zn-dependent peptidase ImmA (M78 family)